MDTPQTTVTASNPHLGHARSPKVRHSLLCFPREHQRPTHVATRQQHRLCYLSRFVTGGFESLRLLLE